MWVLRLVTAAIMLELNTGQECGRTTDLRQSLSGRQGQVVEAGHYPAMCQISTQYAGQNVFLGGATLIQKNQLVTLASLISILKLTGEEGEEGDVLPHLDLREGEEGEGECQAKQRPNREISVICGSVNLQGDDKLNESQRRNVTRIVVHPDYSTTDLTNDYAVLVVEPPFDYTDTVSQVCLPKPGEKRREGEECVAMGHGKNDNSEFGLYSTELNEISLPIISHEQCQNTLNSLFFKKNHSLDWTIHDSFLCAGGEATEDTCEGDGGGPLMCRDRGDTPGQEEALAADFGLRGAGDEELRLVQAGITAWGIGCGMDGFPGVYSDMESASCWLDQMMSCYPVKEVEDINFLLQVGLRNNERLPSARGFSDTQCGAWVDSAAADSAACGCRQTLVADSDVTGDTANNFLYDDDIRAGEIDLRGSNEPDYIDEA